MLGLCGGSEWKSLLIVMLTAGILSAFLSGTGIVSILLPLVMSMALQQKNKSDKVFIAPCLCKQYWRAINTYRYSLQYNRR
ncbi:SLC13 family permease [Peribacillus frigoritolerans]|nr:SLC13 family permease [Peribacillus frigoritolerans]